MASTTTVQHRQSNRQKHPENYNRTTAFAIKLRRLCVHCFSPFAAIFKGKDSPAVLRSLKTLPAARRPHGPLGAKAQQGERIRRIAERDPEAQARTAAFRQSLRRLDGRRAAISGSTIDLLGECRPCPGLRGGAGELGADLIVAHSSPVVAALKQATNTIPIVIAVVNDPLGQGFVTSLARPGGNITGFALVEFTMVGKWLELFRAMAPGVRRWRSCRPPSIVGNELPSDRYRRLAECLKVGGRWNEPAGFVFCR